MVLDGSHHPVERLYQPWALFSLLRKQNIEPHSPELPAMYFLSQGRKAITACKNIISMLRLARKCSSMVEHVASIHKALPKINNNYYQEGYSAST